jgi:hypothetical protein
MDTGEYIKNELPPQKWDGTSAHFNKTRRSVFSVRKPLECPVVFSEVPYDMQKIERTKDQQNFAAFLRSHKRGGGGKNAGVQTVKARGKAHVNRLKISEALRNGGKRSVTARPLKRLRRV